MNHIQQYPRGAIAPIASLKYAPAGRYLLYFQILNKKKTIYEFLTIIMHVKYFYIGMRKTYVKSYIKFSGIVFKKRINIFNILS